jgi:peptide/nickel transport system permease protein
MSQTSTSQITTPTAQASPTLQRAVSTAARRPSTLRKLLSNKTAVICVVFIALVVTAALAAPVLVQYTPNEQHLMNRYQGPGRDHWFGADDKGRDVFSRLLYGARVSLFIGTAAAIGSVVMGIALGLLSGYSFGWLDQLIMRILDIMYAFPGILLALLIVSIFGSSILNLILTLSIWGTPTLARIVRAEILSLREREFIEASIALGVSRLRIALVHLLPNCAAPIIVYATMAVAGAILTTAALGFLGLGVAPPTPEWGAMLSDGRKNMRQAPHLVAIPGLAIFLTLLALNFLGDALRDELDPNLNL